GGRVALLHLLCLPTRRSSDLVLASSTFAGKSLVQLAGTGTTTFNGAVNTNSATGVALTGNVQTLNAGITTTGNGVVSFSNAGALARNGKILNYSHERQ